MSSEVSISNQALSWLGGNLITSLDDPTVEAQICKVNYPLLRDAVLEEGKWTFATKRYKLIPNPVGPIYGYSNRFELPNDVLTVFQVTRNAENANESDLFDHRIEERFIVADVDVLWMKCIVRITDVSKFTSTFTQALAARLSAEIAITLTESTTKETRMFEKYAKNMKTALAIDGMQGTSDYARTASRLVRRR